VEIIGVTNLPATDDHKRSAIFKKRGDHSDLPHSDILCQSIRAAGARATQETGFWDKNSKMEVIDFVHRSSVGARSLNHSKTREPGVGIAESSLCSAFPQKMVRNFRENLQRLSRLTQVRPEGEQASGPKTTVLGITKPRMPRKPALDSQFEVAYRIACYLTEAYHGQQEPNPLFVGEKEPPISLLRYIDRLMKLTNKWVEERDGPDSFGVRCALLAVDYLERLDVKLGPKAVHRYFMTAYLIGIKLLYDYYISNTFWAEVSGCPRAQVNLMELHLCEKLKWDFSVPEERHMQYTRRFLRNKSAGDGDGDEPSAP